MQLRDVVFTRKTNSKYKKRLSATCYIENDVLERPSVKIRYTIQSIVIEAWCFKQLQVFL